MKPMNDVSFRRSVTQSLRGIRRALESQVVLEERRLEEIVESEARTAAQGAELVGGAQLVQGGNQVGHGLPFFLFG